LKWVLSELFLSALRHHNKMVALIVVARKLLLVIYTLWKKDEEYNPA
jgi:hypothetical protein